MRRLQKAKQFAESFLGDHERAGEQPTQPNESGGTTGNGGGGLMGMASHAATAYFSGGNKEVPEGGQVGEQPQAVGATSAGGGGESGLLGMASHAATKYFSGDKEGVGGGTADTGLVDKLLATFEQKEGRKVWHHGPLATCFLPRGLASP